MLVRFPFRFGFRMSTRMLHKTRKASGRRDWAYSHCSHGWPCREWQTGPEAGRRDLFASCSEPGAGSGLLFIITLYPVSGWLAGSHIVSLSFSRWANGLREVRRLAQKNSSVKLLQFSGECVAEAHRFRHRPAALHPFLCSCALATHKCTQAR